MEDKAETIGGAIAVAGVKTRDIEKVLLLLVKAAPASLFLPPRRRFWEKMQQAEDWAIKRDRELWWKLIN